MFDWNLRLIMIGPRAAKMKIAVLKLRMFNTKKQSWISTISWPPWIQHLNTLIPLGCWWYSCSVLRKATVCPRFAKWFRPLASSRGGLSALWGFFPPSKRNGIFHLWKTVYFTWYKPYISAAENSVFSLPSFHMVLRPRYGRSEDLVTRLQQEAAADAEKDLGAAIGLHNNGWCKNL